MFTAFSSALSALTGHTTAVDVVGNNLANLNTIGFKRSEVSFYDLLSRTLGASGQTQVGMGVGRPFTSRQFNQGAIQTTSGRLDAAIQGEGLFVVKDANGGILYTRAGNFKKTADGMMVTATGERVQGWVADTEGNVTSTGAVGDIRLPEGSLRPASATENLFLTLNLNAADDPGANSLFRVPVRTFDSLGNELIVTLNYEKTGPNNWQVWADALDPAMGVITPDDTAKVDLVFDSLGSLIEINGEDQTVDPPPNTTVELNLTGLGSGASDFDVQVNFFAPTGAPLVSQYAQPSAIAGLVQDGQPAAQLSRVAIGDNGVLLAQYSDGTENIIGQLALASVGNPETLVAVGNNAFRVSANSAEPVIGAAGTGGRGTIVGGATEASGADMAREFTNLIVYQRGYQANARVITTADELSAETINLKR